jgi:hypothetical protein
VNDVCLTTCASQHENWHLVAFLTQLDAEIPAVAVRQTYIQNDGIEPSIIGEQEGVCLMQRGSSGYGELPAFRQLLSQRLAQSLIVFYNQNGPFEQHFPAPVRNGKQTVLGLQSRQQFDTVLALQSHRGRLNLSLAKVRVGAAHGRQGSCWLSQPPAPGDCHTLLTEVRLRKDGSL